jgi:hypothetical protein
MPVDTTSPCSVAAVKILSSAISPPPLRRRFPCPTVPGAGLPPGCPGRFLLKVAVPEVLLVCNVRKLGFPALYDV